MGCPSEGCQSEGELTLADLKLLPTKTVASVLQCSGNGRAFFDHKPSGSPWAVGAAGCALWTGVSVADVSRSLVDRATDLSDRNRR